MPYRTSPSTALRLLPGVVVVAALAFVATELGRMAPVVGAPVFAIVGGVVIAALRRPAPALRPGISFSARRVLQGSIVVLGTGLSLTQVVQTGKTSLPVLIGTLLVALGAAWVIGRRLGLRRDLNLLIGVGTAICGASAIAATDSVLDADDADVTYAVATIFTFNIVAVLLYPTLGHVLGLSQHAFGLWAGTAINDTSSVVAASTIYGHAAAQYGVVVKLTRTLAIVPICLGLALWRRQQLAVPAVETITDEEPTGVSSRGGVAVEARPVTAVDDSLGGAPVQVQWTSVAPLFILGFLAAVGLNSLGLVPAGWHVGLSTLATWMITAALGAIGLTTEVGHIRRAGPRPLLLGACLWATVGLTSLGIQRLVGLG